MTSGNLEQSLKPGFTPAERDVPSFVDALKVLGDKEAKKAARALMTVAAAPLKSALLAALDDAKRPQRARLASLLGKLAHESKDETLHLLVASLAFDDDPKTVTAAIRALALLPSSVAAAPLLALAEGRVRPEHRLVLAKSLAQLGGEAGKTGLALLGEAKTATESLSLAKSRAILRRDEARETPSKIDSAADASGLAALAFVREGLTRLAARELKDLGIEASVDTPSLVRFSVKGNLSSLFRARTPEKFALVARDPDDAGALIRFFTSGPARVRYHDPSLSRAKLWELAEEFATRAGVINDPRASIWEIQPMPAGYALVPRELPDPRFSYRRAEVPAASHPSLAAALAFVARPTAQDVIWDPFVGSAMELVECAKRAPFARLFGTDITASALDAAAQNLRAAGVTAALSQQDALTFRGVRPTLVVTNPPMGRRVSRDGSIEVLLTSFVRHAARSLVPGGRLIMASPLPRATVAAAAQSGLLLKEAFPFDMGGFPAELQAFTKPSVPRR